MKRFLLRLKYSFCRTNAYLASLRGDALELAFWEARAMSAESDLIRLDINRRYS